MPCNHIMLDLETLSTRKDAAIIQIAALAFDPETGETGSEFCIFICSPSGHVDVGTVTWWMQQAQAKNVGAHTAAGTTEQLALDLFAEWMRDLDPAVPVEALWSHGATFDIVLLENCYTRAGLGKPWSYKVERDTRTLYALAPGGMPAVQTDPARVHDARYDCEVQVQQVVGALRALREQSAKAKHADAWQDELRVTEESRANWENAYYEIQNLRTGQVPAFSRAEAAVEALANPALRYDEVAPPSSDDCPVSSDYSPCAP